MNPRILDALTKLLPQHAEAWKDAKQLLQLADELRATGLLETQQQLPLPAPEPQSLVLAVPPTRQKRGHQGCTVQKRNGTMCDKRMIPGEGVCSFHLHGRQRQKKKTAPPGQQSLKLTAPKAKIEIPRKPKGAIRWPGKNKEARMHMQLAVVAIAQAAKGKGLRVASLAKRLGITEQATRKVVKDAGLVLRGKDRWCLKTTTPPTMNGVGGHDDDQQEIRS